MRISHATEREPEGRAGGGTGKRGLCMQAPSEKTVHTCQIWVVVITPFWLFMASSWCVSVEFIPQALVGFYSVHNPGRLNDLDSILERYAGKEELLVERLESKYSIDLSYARRAAAASVALGRVGAPRVASVGDLSSLPLRPSPQEHHHRHHQQQQQQRQQSHQTRLHSSTSAAAAAAAAATPGLVHGAPTKYSSGAVGAGASPSSSYMTYLADQIRSNVGGFLPASNNPSGGGVGGGGGGVYPGPFAPPSAPIAGGEKQLTAGFDGGAAARGPGGAGLGATMNAGSKNMSRSISSSSSSNRHQYVGGGSDPVLTARVRALEEERGGLLAACRRMQGKADAAAREVSVFHCVAALWIHVSVEPCRPAYLPASPPEV